MLLKCSAGHWQHWSTAQQTYHCGNQLISYEVPLIYYIHYTLLCLSYLNWRLPLDLIIPSKKEIQNKYNKNTLGMLRNFSVLAYVTCTKSMAVGIWRTIFCSFNFNHYNPLTLSILCLKLWSLWGHSNLEFPMWSVFWIISIYYHCM